MAVPSGVIVGWPSTEASIPSGWSRKTVLDAKYPKGIATSSTAPGTTGGAATHSHTTGSSHTHTTDHSHTLTGSTNAAAGTGTAGLTGGTTYSAASHTHTLAAGVASASPGASGSATPNSDTQNNDPAYWEVIWIESDGSPTGIPNGAVAYINSASAPTGWTHHASGKARFLKGAAASGDGNTTGGSHTHTHATATHDHSVASHTHSSSGTTGTPSATAGGTNAAGGLRALGTHTHTHSGSAQTGTSGSTVTSETASGSGSTEPSYLKVMITKNESGGADLPNGIIALWTGALASIPTNWTLCDGNNGTPNLVAVYPEGANLTSEVGNTGGATSHTHSDPGTHVHALGTHVHATTMGNASTSTNGSGSTPNLPTNVHTHGATPNTDASTDNTGIGTAGSYNTPSSEPPYYEVAFIMYSSTVQIAPELSGRPYNRTVMHQLMAF